MYCLVLKRSRVAFCFPLCERSCLEGVSIMAGSNKSTELKTGNKKAKSGEKEEGKEPAQAKSHVVGVVAAVDVNAEKQADAASEPPTKKMKTGDSTLLSNQSLLSVLSDVELKRNRDKANFYQKLVDAWPSHMLHDKATVKRLLTYEVERWEIASYGSFGSGMSLLCKESFFVRMGKCLSERDANLWSTVLSLGEVGHLDGFDQQRLSVLTKDLLVCKLRGELLEDIGTIPYGNLKWSEISVSLKVLLLQFCFVLVISLTGVAFVCIWCYKQKLRGKKSKSEGTEKEPVVLLGRILTHLREALKEEGKLLESCPHTVVEVRKVGGSEKYSIPPFW